MSAADDHHREDDDAPTEHEIRNALRVLCAGDNGSIDEVLTLWNAQPHYAVALLPSAALAAIFAATEIRRDVSNGGMDQVAWNHGEERSHSYADAFRAIGVVENADLLDRLADALSAYHASHADDAVAADPVHHFMAWRRSVGGPEFGVPDPDDELAESVLEYVIERASTLPDAEAALPRKSDEPGAQ